MHRLERLALDDSFLADALEAMKKPDPTQKTWMISRRLPKQVVKKYGAYAVAQAIDSNIHF